MSHRPPVTSFCAALLLVFGSCLLPNAPRAHGQAKPKELVWTHAFDLSSRRLGELDFTKETQKFGVEAFRDTNNDLGLYISQTGSLAAAHDFKDLKLPVENKSPEWLTGLDLPARKAGEEKFDNARVHSMEVFRDPITENWLYITEKGYLAACSAKAKPSPGAERKPALMHSVDLRVRKGGVKGWEEAIKYGVEVYRDNATGNLVYISETGAIAVIPDTGNVKPGYEGKAPVWLHGLDLACRKSSEPSFSKETRKFGVEVFQDTNNGNLIFIGETGNLAVTGGPKSITAPTEKLKEPQWTHGLNLKARKVGEKDFTEKTTVFGAEAFREDNLDAVIYFGETGSMTAVAR
jgi:hypothetical protein